MEGSPLAGIKGGSPRAPRGSMLALNKEYLAERNAQLALKRRSSEIDLAIRECQLLPVGALRVQLSFLIAAAREAVRAWHVKLPPQLIGRDLHQIGQVLREAEEELLNTLAALPEQLEAAGPRSNGEESAETIGELAAEERRKARDKRWNAVRREKRKQGGVGGAP